MSYFVYILKSKKTERYYIGYTSDIVCRLEKHNAGATTSTRSGRPWELLYYEEFQEKKLAILREREIKKKKSRVYIEALINSFSGSDA
ncbi:GIY-YIG nuclease family protein [Marinifilum sp. D737]|uniref:GIY-YIG nuclease family protein n=1 Tax=Marinifilum sp. D737 TaxID=2969628 RepID=UPI002276BEAB|nr:GIY-YIG nuclease family protein [Marinifilum sp. D737]MCY1633173.1 GIY-YIG nuclease family protein [Marinifilum sp. D737]